MADSLLQQAGYECSTDLPVHPDKLTPDMHCYKIEKTTDCHSITNKYLYKTHFPPRLTSRFLAESK